MWTAPHVYVCTASHVYMYAYVDCPSCSRMRMCCNLDGSTNTASARAGQGALDLPGAGVGNKGQIIVDSNGFEGAAGSDAIAIHPGAANVPYPFLVVKYGQPPVCQTHPSVYPPSCATHLLLCLLASIVCHLLRLPCAARYLPFACLLCPSRMSCVCRSFAVRDVCMPVVAPSCRPLTFSVIIAHRHGHASLSGHPTPPILRAAPSPTA